MSDQATGILSPYLRKKRIQMAIPYLKGKILDFGCGTGKLSEYVRNEDYLGVDIDDESIMIAKKDYPSYNFCVIREIESIEKKFDTVVALAVVEHIKNPVDYLKKFKKLLNPGGRIILTTPHPSTAWIYSAGSKLGFFSNAASEEHEGFIGYELMKQIAESSGLRIVFYKKFLSGVNQLFVLKDINGSNNFVLGLK